MRLQEILKLTAHRPWCLPTGDWKYYQEWNNAVFLHWQVDYNELKKFVPCDLEIDLFEGRPWVSLVAFTMEKIRPRYLPSFYPISNFHEVNIRTYVKYNNKEGVYFLSIEGGTKISCQVARTMSELPYRHSRMERQVNYYCSENSSFEDRLELRFQVGPQVTKKTNLDKWLTEKYALFQDTDTSINEFEIHHIEWPIYKIDFKSVDLSYPKFDKLLSNTPNLSHYSTGVQVIAWDRNKTKKQATTSAATH